MASYKTVWLLFLLSWLPFSHSAVISSRANLASPTNQSTLSHDRTYPVPNTNYILGFDYPLPKRTTHLFPPDVQGAIAAGLADQAAHHPASVPLAGHVDYTSGQVTIRMGCMPFWTQPMTWAEVGVALNGLKAYFEELSDYRTAGFTLYTGDRVVAFGSIAAPLSNGGGGVLGSFC